MAALISFGTSFVRAVVLRFLFRTTPSLPLRDTISSFFIIIIFHLPTLFIFQAKVFLTFRGSILFVYIHITRATPDRHTPPCLTLPPWTPFSSFLSITHLQSIATGIFGGIRYEFSFPAPSFPSASFVISSLSNFLFLSHTLSSLVSFDFAFHCGCSLFFFLAVLITFCSCSYLSYLTTLSQTSLVGVELVANTQVSTPSQPFLPAPLFTQSFSHQLCVWFRDTTRTSTSSDETYVALPIMPDISSTSDAERTRRIHRKIKDTLNLTTSSFQRLGLPNPSASSDLPSSTASPLAGTSADGAGNSSSTSAMDPVSNSKSKPSGTSSSTAHMSSSNGYPSGNRGPSPGADQDAGATLTSDDATAHLVAKQSALAAPFNNNHTTPSSPPPFFPKVEKLSYSNYTFWYMSLRLAAAVYRCEEHIVSDPPPPADPEGKDSHRRAAAQAWLLLTQSVPEEIRHQLSIDDLSSTPHTICEKLKQVVLSRPENSRVFLLSRAQNLILRKGDSMSDYLAKHDDIRQRMILVDHIKEDDEATTILFILCGLRQNPDYAEVCSSLSVKSAASTLSLASLKHDLLREEQYLTAKSEPGPSNGRNNANIASTGNNNGGLNKDGRHSQNGNTGMWCTFHEVSTHDTDQCQAKARHEAMANKWCSFHESNTHDTSECKAKARHETMGSKWCSFHESHSHNTDECEAKRRQDDYNSKWCTYHESHTHNTDECQAKARHDALYAR